MSEPVVLAREAHSISRKHIDADALKVLYRLHHSNYVAYLVGGSVRDLLLGRKPKDFDIGTSAHPYQVKKLFRNCWIIGRRFRLAHVRFGMKTIEVATFRRPLGADEAEVVADAQPAEPPPSPDVFPRDPDALVDDSAHDHFVHRDNTFGTPEEDAFRRDFTINALFYDIGTFSIIDYTGGLADLRNGLIRCIGDPRDRFREDPVRMLRAVAMAARLDFKIDPPIDEAIIDTRGEIARSAPARLIEEFYKLLRSGASERAFQMLAERGLLEPVAHQLQTNAKPRLWQSLAALDAYRRRFESIPDTLTNAVLMGSLLVPLGHSLQTLTPPATESNGKKEPRLSMGMLPLARRDVERLRQILGLQRRLMDTSLSPRARRALMHRGPFREALTWLEIHGQAPEAVEHWRGFIEAAGAYEGEAKEAERPRRRRRRRGRRRPFRSPTH
ncbi:MAG TPA: polynucleotide adenylyltransferase PcnB [Vicinamibacterales bacterium]|nr:polynucleotide adenylyltransferase PcnB [Vicinamibacterales bacterium]